MKTLLTLITLLISHLLFAQVKTEAYFGVSGRNDGCADVIEIYDKGYYISGGFDEYGNYIYDGWNIKTDINLEFIYDKVLDHAESSISISSSTSDNNGNIYFTGFMNSPFQWPFVTKIDSCGNKIWCKILDYSFEWFEDGWPMIY
ncbi:MAG: hypothetical protein Kow00127_17640 [Bacteroidales bacterium]